MYVSVLEKCQDLTDFYPHGKQRNECSQALNLMPWNHNSEGTDKKVGANCIVLVGEGTKVYNKYGMILTRGSYTRTDK